MANIKYYDIMPCDKAYHGKNLLTYSSNESLKIGQLVVVKIRTKTINGLVIRQVPKTQFSVKNIDFVLPNIVLPNNLIETIDWMRKYYPDNLGVIGSLFCPILLPQNIIPSKIITTTPNDSAVSNVKEVLPTNEQKSIISSILKSDNTTHILHGDTGTGKTYVYQKLCEHIFLSGKSAIVLTPEINLLPQLVETFKESFSNVYLVHSKQSVSERRKIWLNILQALEPVIVIGPRSSLFYPVKNLGMIIIDEFHEKSYKQEQSPHYNALRVAGFLSKASSAKLVMGSATPPIEEYFYAINKGAELHRLTKKPNLVNHKNNVLCVNMTDDKERTQYPMLSKSLLSNIKHTLSNNQQVLLFLNKRGSSRLVLCKNCGWTVECIRCNIPYVYHHDIHLLVCHSCALKKPVPTNCPECGNDDIIYKNPGTKQIEQAINNLFKGYKIGRYDKDNKKNESFITNYPEIAAGNIDILIGTQTLTKGHDLPNLGLVAILSGDSSLNFPDYNAHEKTYQILHQVAGRVGRHQSPGTIILQSYSMLESLKEYVSHTQNSWINFYHKELKQREKYNFPPYCFILKIELKRKNNKLAQEFMQKIYMDLTNNKYPNTVITEPTSSFISKQNAFYNWQIIIRSKSRKILLDIINSLPKSCTYDIDPSSLL